MNWEKYYQWWSRTPLLQNLISLSLGLLIAPALCIHFALGVMMMLGTFLYHWSTHHAIVRHYERISNINRNRKTHELDL